MAGRLSRALVWRRVAEGEPARLARSRPSVPVRLDRRRLGEGADARRRPLRRHMGGEAAEALAREIMASMRLAAALLFAVSASFQWPIPEGWQHETIPFPLEFAPDLPYQGVEELRF